MHSKMRRNLNFIPSKDWKIVQSINIGIIIFFIFLLSSSLWSLRNLKSEYSFEQFFPKNDPRIVDDFHINQEFKLNDKNDVILIIKNHRSWLHRKEMALLKSYTVTLRQFDEVEQVLSLSAMEGSFAAEKQLYVGPLFDSVPNRFWHKLVQSHSLISPHLLSRDGSVTLVLVRLKKNEAGVLASFRNRLRAYSEKYFPTIQFEFGGIPAIQADLSLLLNKELVRSLVISFFIFTFGLILVFKNYSGVIITTLSLLVVNTIAIGFLSKLGIAFNVMLSTLPVLTSLTIVSLVVHTLFRFSEKPDSPSHFNKFFLIVDVLEELFVENFLASVTTSIGFLMLATSNVVMIKHFGIIVATTNLLVWILTQFLLIPLGVYLPKPELRAWTSQKAYWGLWLLRYKRSLFKMITVAFVICAVSIFQLNWNPRLFDDLPSENPTRMTTEKIDKNFGGLLSYEFVISGKKGTWVNPKDLYKLNRFSEALKKLPTVGSVISAADFFKQTTETGTRLPATAGETSEISFMLAMSSHNPMNHFLTSDNSKTRVHIRFRDNPYTQIKEDQQKIFFLASQYFPSFRFEVGGIGSIVHQLNNNISRDLVFGFWQSLFLIALILILVFRSLRWALVATLPNLIAPVFLVGILAAAQTPIKPSIAIVFSIVIGLAFTNTIYLLGRLRSLMTGKTKRGLPVKRMLLSEGNSCLIATLLVLSGFSVFLFSYFKLNQLFGIYMIASIIGGAIGDLVFLPTLLALHPRILKKSRGQEILIVFVLMLIPLKGKAQADEILRKSKQTMESHDDSGRVQMKIIEADGSTKTRDLMLKRMSSDKQYAMVRLLSPKELKGTAVLFVVDKEQENQWLYLPSSKQIRRVVGNNKEAGILGSELTPQDLDFNTLKGSSAKLIKKTKLGRVPVSVLEIKSISNGTSYSKAWVWISMKSYLPSKIEYYDQAGKILKRVEFKKYAKVGKSSRATFISVKNLQNNRRTEIRLFQLKSNTGLSKNEFTERALSTE